MVINASETDVTCSLKSFLPAVINTVGILKCRYLDVVLTDVVLFN
jgi:hypothetical protein